MTASEGPHLTTHREFSPEEQAYISWLKVETVKVENGERKLRIYAKELFSKGGPFGLTPDKIAQLIQEGIIRHTDITEKFDEDWRLAADYPLTQPVLAPEDLDDVYVPSRNNDEEIPLWLREVIDSTFANRERIERWIGEAEEEGRSMEEIIAYIGDVDLDYQIYRLLVPQGGFIVLGKNGKWILNKDSYFYNAATGKVKPILTTKDLRDMERVGIELQDLFGNVLRGEDVS